MVVFCVVISWVNDQRIWKSPTILKWLLINIILDFVRCSRTEKFCKKCVVNNFVKLMEKHLCQSLFFNKFTGLGTRACNFIKKDTLTQVFSYEFWESFKRIFFTGHLWTTASTLFYFSCSGYDFTVIKKSYSLNCYSFLQKFFS